ncbi:MAG: LapA family protein [Pseudomonadales bacterium]|nr:LapA family protein [Pseudomonadales bacterium]
MPWIKRLPIAVCILIACSYIFIFSLRNNQLVDVDLLFIVLPQMKIELVIIATFIVGSLTGVLSSLLLMAKMRRKYRVRLYKAERQQKMSESKV